MNQDATFNQALKPALTTLTYLSCAVFAILTILLWMPIDDFDALAVFRNFSALIICFVAGLLWGMAFVLNNPNSKIAFQPQGLFWGALLIFLGTVGVLFLEVKSGVFIAALLYLVLWQVENKSNLARLYPEWFWVLRTKATMIVAICHMLIWMTHS